MKRPGFVLALLLIIIFGLSACGGPRYASPGKPVGQSGGNKTKPDLLLERRIILAYSKTNEKLDLVYYRNGTYVPDALRAINRLMRDRRTNEIGPIDPEVIDFLVDIRTRLTLPQTVVFTILSGYRSRETNEELSRSISGVAKESLHMYGWAVDFRVDGVDGRTIAEVAKTMQRGGVSFYPSDNHVHVDIGNIRTWKTK